MNVSGKFNSRQNIKSALENKAPGSLQWKYLCAAPEATQMQQGEQIACLQSAAVSLHP